MRPTAREKQRQRKQEGRQQCDYPNVQVIDLSLKEAVGKIL
jgi:hypothetical protein